MQIDSGHGGSNEKSGGGILLRWMTGIAGCVPMRGANFRNHANPRNCPDCVAVGGRDDL
ncbi:hypothetical protein RE6C_01861 [Rhodopirellula europaea 6C]|uniref:Uncharacterized protein n=1 Tax=Rhodopirellula europaea 6C TaxID=1263867 RepID=M2B6F2_9BACT|nr:hypothetical protein RE6C_01861 [Rhodopirellula europaea 6C]